MSKKIYMGIVAGVLFGIAVPLLMKFKHEEDLFSDEDLSDENDMMEKANNYLLLARNKVEEMVTEATQKSDSYLHEAGKILSSAKEKTSSIHYDQKELAEEEINKVKAEIALSIEEFKKRIN